jgi:hypothetical protein
VKGANNFSFNQFRMEIFTHNFLRFSNAVAESGALHVASYFRKYGILAYDRKLVVQVEVGFAEIETDF